MCQSATFWGLSGVVSLFSAQAMRGRVKVKFKVKMKRFDI